MPYVAGDFLVNITGIIVGGEIWSNTWCFQGATTEGEKQDCVDALHQFYLDLSANFSEHWSAEAAMGRDLSTGLSASYTFAQITGDVLDTTAVPVPDQLAIRVSLSNALGHRGGPFLAGWTVADVSGGARILAATQTLVVDTLENLNANVVSNGQAIGINRPTVLNVNGATIGRVGERWDVIRKRANEILEVYVQTGLG